MYAVHMIHKITNANYSTYVIHKVNVNFIQSSLILLALDHKITCPTISLKSVIASKVLLIFLFFFVPFSYFLIFLFHYKKDNAKILKNEIKK